MTQTAPSPTDVGAAEFQAVEVTFKSDLIKAKMQLVKYRLALEEHGIEPPDADGAELLEMWRDCKAVVTTASDFVAGLGTAKELLQDWGRT